MKQDPATTWRPGATWTMLELRAELLAMLRDWMRGRGIVEVETPYLVRRGVTDVHLAGIRCRLAGPPARELMLHTSPEYHMKRLLCAGAPDIYQLGRVFRDAELGARHEPEFTMLEWYRHERELETMIDETLELVAATTSRLGRRPEAIRIHTYRELIGAVTGIDVFDTDDARLVAAVREVLGTGVVDDRLTSALGQDRDAWLDLLLSEQVLPSLPARSLSVIRDYPASQAALARLKPDDPRVAERFEVFFNGLELANGYRELRDPDEQCRRFERDRARRRQRGLPDVEPDEALLAALTHGLPDCCGVALGVDRLIMAGTGRPRIRDVIAFDDTGR